MYWRGKSFYDWCWKCIGITVADFCLLFTDLTAEKGDENLLMICEKNQENEEERGKREMKSQRDILRVIEKEIKKGSAPVAFAGSGVFRGMLSFGR